MPRLDVYLVEHGICHSRHQAKLWIEAGQITVNGQVTTKVSLRITNQTVSRVSGHPTYVSRGGLKLAFALNTFQLTLDGLCCADIGSSTGGFTDVCLQNGAKHVYSIDVGHEQMHQSLRNDPRITLMEGTNIRTLTGLPEPIDFLCCDVSFCSLQLLLEPIYNLQPTEAILLIKPQFEVGADALRKGRVKHESDRIRVINQITLEAKKIGFQVAGCCDSPLPGAKKGNIESLLWLRLSA